MCVIYLHQRHLNKKLDEYAYDTEEDLNKHITVNIHKTTKETLRNGNSQEMPQNKNYMWLEAIEKQTKRRK